MHIMADALHQLHNVPPQNWSAAHSRLAAPCGSGFGAEKKLIDDD